MRARTFKRLRQATIVAFALLSAMFVLDLVFPLPEHRLYPDSSLIVEDRNGEIMRVFLAPDEMWRMRAKSDELSPALIDAVLQYEDRYFRYHPGVNPFSVLRAAWVDLKEGSFVLGASTITMQVARLIEPKERTIPAKLKELLRALQLELHYSKDEILAFYFNLAPYGGNIVGVKAASYIYFNKPPSALSYGEAALLAALPNSPNTLRPDLHCANAEKARRKVLQVLTSRGRISSTQLKEALSEPIPCGRTELPFEIPHLSTDLALDNPESDILKTTVDARVQRLCERLMRAGLDPLGSHGIENGAVVVIDNESRDILALVGSRDFDDSETQGQVNGARAPRSPGSALKPFIYALALDRGLISEKSILFDVPVDYSGYSPENYDGLFNGPVTARGALIRSLNVPAVRLEDEVGVSRFYRLLKNAGVRSLDKDYEHYGLSLILGGGEITLLELTSLYAGLANGGRFRDPRVLLTEDAPPARKLLSEESAYIVADILTDLRRPDLPSVWDWSVDMPKVAWKTGTSYGRRDAWSVGFTPNYTVGVWVGNFDGTGVPELVGAEAAAPILFSIITTLEKSRQSSWFTAPDGLARRSVCTASGHICTDLCGPAMTEYYIPGISPSRSCEVHQAVLVDTTTGYRLCSRSDRNEHTQQIVCEMWPPEVSSFLRENGYSIQPIPPLNPECTRVVNNHPPLIKSPSDGAEYRIRPGVDTEYQKILLKASVSNSTSRIYWFLDEELIHSGSASDRVFIDPTPGYHSLVCIDKEGRSTEVVFSVTD